MNIITLFLFIFTGLQAGELPKPPLQSTDSYKTLENPGGSEIINDWITIHLEIIESCKIPSHHNRQLAYTGIAMYESIVAGDKNYRSLAGQLNGYQQPLLLPGTDNICWPASANSAISAMLRFFYPQNPVDIIRIDSLENVWVQRLISEGNSEASVLKGKKYGSQVALAVINWSKTDGDDKANGVYSLPKETGLWEPTPPMFIPPIMPFLGNERTMVKGSIDNTMPPPPTSFSTESQSLSTK